MHIRSDLFQVQSTDVGVSILGALCTADFLVLWLKIWVAPLLLKLYLSVNTAVDHWSFTGNAKHMASLRCGPPNQIIGLAMDHVTHACVPVALANFS